MSFKTSAVDGYGLVYQHGIKKIFFLHDPEKIHEYVTSTGEFLGHIPLVKGLVGSFFADHDSRLLQTIAGITFKSPLGLAAGFDYDAKLTQLLPSLGFGFGTVGTITNKSYGGNPRPMLGRLPKSRSLMVNKGFKNKGAKVIAEKLAKLDYTFPLGISIGRSNTLALKTQKESIQDILSTFHIFESAKIQNSYYELNISCPNLKGNVTFYPPKNLRELLSEVTRLHLTKPLFIKMPIEKTNKEFLQMMDVISNYPVAAVIIGNLQKNRRDPAFVASELEKFPVGHFSGKPTFRRSNELIALTYKTFGKNMAIIGCGGVFNAEDAYIKIKLGASLVQLITGLIYQGPQVVSQMNRGLVALLKKDGFTSLAKARGHNA